MLAVIVAAGDPDPSDTRWLADADLVIAADSGACWLEQIGVTPRLLVGDLDSVGEPLVERYAAAGVEIDRHPAAKDESDAELALERAVASGAAADIPRSRQRRQLPSGLKCRHWPLLLHRRHRAPDGRPGPGTAVGPKPDLQEHGPS